jgi:hypothetical protein
VCKQQLEHTVVLFLPRGGHAWCCALSMTGMSPRLHVLPLGRHAWYRAVHMLDLMMCPFLESLLPAYCVPTPVPKAVGCSRVPAAVRAEHRQGETQGIRGRFHCDGEFGEQCLCPECFGNTRCCVGRSLDLNRQHEKDIRNPRFQNMFSRALHYLYHYPSAIGSQ